nr:MAG TPA: hypothetical protein [Caudoviricetes sp.]
MCNFHGFNSFSISRQAIRKGFEFIECNKSQVRYCFYNISNNFLLIVFRS